MVSDQKKIKAIKREFNAWCEDQFNIGNPITREALQKDPMVIRKFRELCEANGVLYESLPQEGVFNEIPYGRMVKIFQDNVERLLYTKKNEYLKVRYDGDLASQCMLSLTKQGTVHRMQGETFLSVLNTSVKIHIFDEMELRNYFFKEKTKDHYKLFYFHVSKSDTQGYVLRTSPWLKLLYVFSGEHFNSLFVSSKGYIRENFTIQSLFFFAEDGEGQVSMQRFTNKPYGLGIKHWFKNTFKDKGGSCDHQISINIVNSILCSL